MGAESKVSKTTFVLMLVVFILYDLVQFGVQFIPVVGQVAGSLVGALAWLHMFIWFYMHGVSYGKSKTRFLVALATPIIELIPLLGALPGWTVQVIVMTLSVWAEEKAAQHSAIAGRAVAATQNKGRAGGAASVQSARAAAKEEGRQLSRQKAQKAGGSKGKRREDEAKDPQQRKYKESQYYKEPDAHESKVVNIREGEKLRRGKEAEKPRQSETDLDKKRRELYDRYIGARKRLERAQQEGKYGTPEYIAASQEVMRHEKEFKDFNRDRWAA